MDKAIANKLKQVMAKASGSNTGDQFAPEKETALSRVIKTKEQADLFMKRLRALHQ